MRSIPDPVYRFADALRGLMAAETPGAVESQWSDVGLEQVGWKALGFAWQDDDPDWEPALNEADRFLKSLLRRLPLLAAAADREASHVRTFRLPELERLHHATAAALVAQRFGVAGLRTVLADQEAPVARRYFAFVALAERHPASEWPVFERYLTPEAHHAFVGTAAEAARFYPSGGAASRLVVLFDRIRSDVQLREFLGCRILESLFVLSDPGTLPFYRGLLTGGYTNRDPLRCEVTHALVMVRRFTGQLAPNCKFSDLDTRAVVRCVDAAEREYQLSAEQLTKVVVI